MRMLDKLQMIVQDHDLAGLFPACGQPAKAPVVKQSLLDLKLAQSPVRAIDTPVTRR